MTSKEELDRYGTWAKLMPRESEGFSETSLEPDNELGGLQKKPQDDDSGFEILDMFPQQDKEESKDSMEELVSGGFDQSGGPGSSFSFDEIESVEEIMPDEEVPLEGGALAEKQEMEADIEELPFEYRYAMEQSKLDVLEDTETASAMHDDFSPEIAEIGREAARVHENAELKKESGTKTGGTMAQQESRDFSNELLMRIADELGSIRTELVSLKTQLAEVQGAAAAGLAAKAKDEDSHAKFFNDEDDETIALTGDELNNIFHSADFTEEEVEDAIIPDVSDNDSFPSANDSFSMEDEPRGDLLPEDGDYSQPTLQETATMEAEEESLFEELEEAAESPLTEAGNDLAYLDSDFGEEPAKAGEDFDLTSTKTEDNAEDFGNMAELEELDFLESSEPIEPHTNTSPLEKTTETSANWPEDQNIEELESLSELEELNYEPEALSEHDAFALPEEDLEGEAKIQLEGVADIEFEESGMEGAEDTFDSSSTDEIAELTAVPEESQEEFFDMPLEEMPAEIAEEEPAMPIEPVAAATATIDPKDEKMKEEIRAILAYLDRLLDALPEEKIEEFAHSKYFETYKRLFSELGLT